MKDLNTSPEGLSQAEAQQRLQENGPNQLKEAKKKILANFIFRNLQRREW